MPLRSLKGFQMQDWEWGCVKLWTLERTPVNVARSRGGMLGLWGVGRRLFPEKHHQSCLLRDEPRQDANWSFEGREGIWLQRNKGVVTVSLRWHSFNHSTTQHNCLKSSEPVGSNASVSWLHTLLFNPVPRPAASMAKGNFPTSNRFQLVLGEPQSLWQTSGYSLRPQKMYMCKILSVHTYMYI